MLTELILYLEILKNQKIIIYIITCIIASCDIWMQMICYITPYITNNNSTLYWAYSDLRIVLDNVLTLKFSEFYFVMKTSLIKYEQIQRET